MKYVALLFSLMISHSIAAQFKYGLSVGTYVNFSGISAAGYQGADYLNDKHPIAGVLMGILVERDLSSDFSIISGINYIQKSMKTAGGRIATSNKGHYINIPLRIQYKGDDPFFFAIGAGANSVIQQFHLEWELQGEAGISFTDQVQLAIGYRQNLSYSGALRMTDINNTPLGFLLFKYRGWHMQVNYYFK